MKFCKVIVCFLFALGFVVGNGTTLSAEEWKEMPANFDYETCMQGARNYEKDKSWIWALDEYYNAMNSFKNAHEFRTGWNN